ncbi:hypothetical protein NQ314_014844 [Rhamnusium bicolor]|uniref:Integrase zinc-binding domain-containing protein n=1 Tax=Rhamnusium bicolor TaxID=1586634 RepID=A0AAV8WZY4_9CUCU|nr:hypothetical protein NQ314_014844 [Rhamnusium bicolor]
MNDSDYSELLQRIKRIRETGPNTSNKNDYYVVNTYDLQRIESSFVILHKRSGKIILSLSECYDAIKAAHQRTGHGGRQATTKLLNEKYYNLTQEMVKLFIETCENCQLKRNKTKKGIVVKPIGALACCRATMAENLQTSCFHSGIGRSPYEALYGVKCRDGLNNFPISTEKN